MDGKRKEVNLENSTFYELVETIRKIPYGRNSNRDDFSLVISENKGTCSSKHAYLKDIAQKQQLENISLHIGIFQMNSENSPRISSLLQQNNLDYIPEAHCYLKIDGNPVDVTFPESFFEKIAPVLIEEIEIEAYQVSDFKVKYHQEFLKKWIKSTQQKLSFEEIWNIRELCIQKLSEYVKFA